MLRNYQKLGGKLLIAEGAIVEEYDIVVQKSIWMKEKKPKIEINAKLLNRPIAIRYRCCVASSGNDVVIYAERKPYCCQRCWHESDGLTRPSVDVTALKNCERRIKTLIFCCNFWISIYCFHLETRQFHNFDVERFKSINLFRYVPIKSDNWSSKLLLEWFFLQRNKLRCYFTCFFFFNLHEIICLFMYFIENIYTNF